MKMKNLIFINFICKHHFQPFNTYPRRDKQSPTVFGYKTRATGRGLRERCAKAVQELRRRYDK